MHRYNYQLQIAPVCFIFCVVGFLVHFSITVRLLVVVLILIPFWRRKMNINPSLKRYVGLNSPFWRGGCDAFCHRRGSCFWFSFTEGEFYFNHLIWEAKNGILMSSLIDFFGKMGIKVGGKTEIWSVYSLLCIVVWWCLCLIF